MTQKTLKVKINKGGFEYEFTKPLEIGEEVMLIEKQNENTGDSEFCLRKGNGVGGNMNREIRKYHGWRGTTNGIATYAHGLRKIIKAGEVVEDEYGDYVQKVTVGRDLKPDEE